MGGSEKGGQRTAFPGRSLRCQRLLWKAGGCSHVQMWRGQPSALLHGEGRGSSLAILIEHCRHLGVREGVGRRWSMGGWVKMVEKLQGRIQTCGLRELTLTALKGLKEGCFSSLSWNFFLTPFKSKSFIKR